MEPTITIAHLGQAASAYPPINTSGKGDASVLPAELRDKFCWGAFLWTWIWGIGNRSYITLLYFLAVIHPVFGLAVMAVCGIKGNEWAWRNKHWDSVDHFRRTQRAWVKWGVVIVGVTVGVSLLVIVYIISNMSFGF